MRTSRTADRAVAADAERGAEGHGRVYVHVPFCLSRCAYCDFYSTTDERWIDAWIDAALREAERALAEGVGTLESLYVGGGTPSRLSATAMTRLLGGLIERFGLAAGAEVTLEANPDDVTSALASAWAAAGVGRVSLGAQSFDDVELRLLERRHGAAAIGAAADRVRAAGIDELSLDLIYALPGQPLDSWRESLDAALAIDPAHLSCYQLTLEPRAPLARRMAADGLAPADEETGRAMFLEAHERLERAGFEHYEISSWARPGHRARHNSAYWRHEACRGLGPAAHSFDGARVRWWNHPSLRRYVEALSRGGDPTEARERLDDDQLLLERLMLGFRTSEGVAMGLVEGISGGRDVAASLAAEGLVTIHGGRVAPTVEGMLVADSLPLRFL